MGLFTVKAREHLKYNDLVNQTLAKQLQMLDLLAIVTFPNDIHCVTTKGLTCLLENRPAVFYIHSQFMESLRKTGPTLANPQLLTKVLYSSSGLPMPATTTASKESLLGCLTHSFVVGEKEGEMLDQEEEDQQRETSTSQASFEKEGLAFQPPPKETDVTPPKA